MLKIAKGVNLPDDVLSDVTAIVGRRGRGKTTTAVVLVEEAHRLKRRFCVVDPTGAWHGLRSSRDGEHPGIPCVIFGGKHAMAPLEPTAGKLLADFVADPTQPSAVLDIKWWSRGEQVRFLSDFLPRLYQKNDAPLLLVLDEADQVAPQSPERNEAPMLGAAQRLVKLGRVSGFGVVLVTQRPATLNKTVMNMAGVLVAMGITGPQDQQAVLDWMKHRADAAQAKEILGSLPGLPQGTAWVWAPELDVLKRVEVRDRWTFDSSATPKHGERAVEPRALAEVDLAKLTADIQATIEQAKANDPRELKAEVQRLTLALKAAQQAKPVAPAPPPEPVRVEVPVLTEEDKARLDALRIDVTDLRDELRRGLERVELLATAASTLQAAVVGRTRPAAPVRTPPQRSAPVREVAQRSAPMRTTAASSWSLGAGERRILIAIAQHKDGVTREQLTVLTGYKRSSRDTYLQRLRAAELVEIAGDGIMATAAGIACLGVRLRAAPDRGRAPPLLVRASPGRRATHPRADRPRAPEADGRWCPNLPAQVVARLSGSADRSPRTGHIAPSSRTLASGRPILRCPAQPAWTPRMPSRCRRPPLASSFQPELRSCQLAAASIASRREARPGQREPS